MKVCIAEKPSVAKEIAYVIGAKSRKDGYYEGNGYQVTWTFGHFCRLWSPEEYHMRWKKWDLDTLPMLPERFETKLMNDKGVKKQFGIIKRLLSNCSEVINCGDAGQEGELIQRWVLKEAKYSGPMRRLWISSLTTEAIRDGFKNLEPAAKYDALYYAGSARAIGDWLLGMNATRLFTIRYGGYKQVLSIGRVQTPTLAMVVQRYHEIENFVSKPFWELQTAYRDATFHCQRGRFDKEEDGQSVLAAVEGKPLTITSVERKEGKEYSPRLFDLTSLQVHCNKRFGYSADQTLKIVQKLYEMKIVTYPRVDTTYLPTDLHPKVPGILSKMSQYQALASPLLQKPIPKHKRVFDNAKVTDHHAIIPTGNETNLDKTYHNVYDAIARRFIGVFYPVCKVANTVVMAEVEQVTFKAKGKEILHPGWKVVFPKPQKKKKEGEEEDKTLPGFVVGESGPHEPKLVSKQTQPPKHYTEATLLRAMETAGKTVEDEELRELMKANGIGRPSTRASIIETLFRRQYIVRSKKLILPTQVGLDLISVIQNELLMSAELTGKWEKRLSDISKGDYNPSRFIKEMKGMVSDLIDEVRMSRLVKQIAAPAKGKSAPRSTKRQSTKSTRSKSSKAKGDKKTIETTSCPLCEAGRLLKGKTAYGCTRWQQGCKLRLPMKYLGKTISPNQIIRLVDKGSTVNLKGFKQDGVKVDGSIKLDKDGNLSFVKKGAETSKSSNSSSSEKMICPKCKKGQIVKGKNAYGCSAWKDGCQFVYPFTQLVEDAKGRKLSRELVVTLLLEKANKDSWQ